MMRNGFSLIEIMVGMLVFAAGVLALTASTGYVNMQMIAADVRTERQVVLQHASEQLYAMDYEDLLASSRTVDDALEIGEYAVWWDVQSVAWALADVQVYSEGPGFDRGRRVDSLTDTLTIRVARPLK